MDTEQAPMTVARDGVWSVNDWQQLREIIVGTARGANDPPLDASLRNFFQPSPEESEGFRVGPVPQTIIDEVEEDIDTFVDVLKGEGVKVRRPNDIPWANQIATPEWRTAGMHALMPRDGFIVIGNTMVETPMACRSRVFETWAYRSLFLEYFQAGSRWLCAPTPRLPDETFVNSPSGWSITNEEPIFDAANLLRCGKHILYNISNTGNEIGRQWLQRAVGENFSVVPTSLCEDHLGTTLFVLRPGVLLANSERLKPEDIPPLFAGWDVIWAPPPENDGFALDFPRASTWIGMNLLSINESTVVVEERQVGLRKTLELKGFTVIPVRYRHGRTLGGGFHCISLDVRRDGPLENYFE